MAANHTDFTNRAQEFIRTPEVTYVHSGYDHNLHIPLYRQRGQMNCDAKSYSKCVAEAESMGAKAVFL